MPSLSSSSSNNISSSRCGARRRSCSYRADEISRARRRHWRLMTRVGVGARLWRSCVRRERACFVAEAVTSVHSPRRPPAAVTFHQSMTSLYVDAAYARVDIVVQPPSSIRPTCASVVRKVVRSLMWAAAGATRGDGALEGWRRQRCRRAVVIRCCCCACCRRLRPLQICLTCSPSPVTSTWPARCPAASTARPKPTRPSRTSSGPRTTGRWSSTEPRAQPATDASGCPDTVRWCSDPLRPPTRACTRVLRTRGSAKANRRLRYIFTSKVRPTPSVDSRVQTTTRNAGGYRSNFYFTA